MACTPQFADPGKGEAAILHQDERPAVFGTDRTQAAVPAAFTSTCFMTGAVEDMDVINL